MDKNVLAVLSFIALFLMWFTVFIIIGSPPINYDSEPRISLLVVEKEKSEYPKPIYVELEELIPNISIREPDRITAYARERDPNLSMLCEETEIIPSFIKKKNFNISGVVRNTIAREVVSKCSANELPISLIMGIIDVESNFNHLGAGTPGVE